MSPCTAQSCWYVAFAGRGMGVSTHLCVLRDESYTMPLEWYCLVSPSSLLRRRKIGWRMFVLAIKANVLDISVYLINSISRYF